MRELICSPEKGGFAAFFFVKYVMFYEAIDSATTTDQWYTPEYIFTAMATHFDLDPASPGAAVVPWIPVTTHYTHHGLEWAWEGCVWLNAPYGRNVLPAWLKKFVSHGNGVTLVADRTSTKWWHELIAASDAILFLNKRIAFVSPYSSVPRTAAAGAALCAIGQKGVKAIENVRDNNMGLILKYYK